VHTKEYTRECHGPQQKPRTVAPYDALPRRHRYLVGPGQPMQSTRRRRACLAKREDGERGEREKGERETEREQGRGA
jgi:hypothetical protein